MERGQFTFYRSFWDAIKVLPPKDRNALLPAICAYALDGEEPMLTGIQMSIFMLIRPTLDTSARKAENGRRGASRAEANEEQTGSKPEANEEQTGSKPEANEEQTGSKPEANRKQTASKPEANGKQTANEKEGEGEKEKEIENESYTRARAREARFSPPSVEEVAAYCRERGNGVDAQAFVDFYTSKGWKVGSSPMKDWRAAVRTWEKREGGSNGSRTAGGDQKPASKYNFTGVRLD